MGNRGCGFMQETGACRVGESGRNRRRSKEGSCGGQTDTAEWRDRGTNTPNSLPVCSMNRSILRPPSILMTASCPTSW